MPESSFNAAMSEGHSKNIETLFEHLKNQFICAIDTLGLYLSADKAQGSRKYVSGKNMSWE